MIRIIRDSGYTDRFRSYKVIVDGQAVGKIKNGGRLEFDLPPGRHRLYLKIDWCRSNLVDFETDSDVIQFECGSNLPGWRSLLALLYITLLPDQYLWLKRTDEPFA